MLATVCIIKEQLNPSSLHKNISYFFCLSVYSLEWERDDGLPGALALVALVLVELARAVAVGARLPRQHVPHPLRLHPRPLAVHAHLRPISMIIRAEAHVHGSAKRL